MENGRMRAFLLRFAWIAAVLALIWAGLRFALPCFLPLIIGGILAAVLHPAAVWLCDRIGRAYRPCAIFVAVLALLLLGLLLWGFGGLIYTQSSALAVKLPGFFRETVVPFLDEVQQWWGTLGERFGGGTAAASWSKTAESAFGEMLTAFSGRMLGWAGNLVGALPSLALTISFSVLSTILFLMDYRRITSFAIRLLPSSALRPLVESKRFLLGSVKKVVGAYLLIMLITFGEIAVGLWLLRVPYFAVIGLVIALLDILPFIGSGMVLIQWGILELLIQKNTPLGLGLMILYAVVALVRFWMEPRIVGGRIGLHPLATLTAMYAGLRLFGFWGFILAPLFVTLVVHLYQCGLLSQRRGRPST